MYHVVGRIPSSDYLLNECQLVMVKICLFLTELVCVFHRVMEVAHEMVTTTKGLTNLREFHCLSNSELQNVAETGYLRPVQELNSQYNVGSVICCGNDNLASL